MTIFGLQEIASSISDFGSEEMKARVLPASPGRSAGAMVLTEPDAGSDLARCRRAPLSTRQRRVAHQRR